MEHAPIPLPGTIPPAPAVMAILDRFNRDELGNAIEVLVALLDIWDGDPDNEPIGDDEPLEANGDTRDAAWIEWQTMRASQKRGPNIASDNEDDEEDDPAGQYDEDHYSAAGTPGGSGAGCPISDPGGCEHDGREPDVDEECEQMPGDVPCLPVATLDYNVFTDTRTPLGLSNLMSTFVGEAKSADTGATHKGGMPDLRSSPGRPV